MRLILLLVLVLPTSGCGDDDARPVDAGPGDAAISCDTGETECGGACVDTDTDPSNCGGCGAACAPGEVCSAGSCELTCPAGQDVCDGGCHTLTTSREHCGTCGTACTDGQVCNAGSCELSCGGSTPTACGDACVDTMSNRDHCGGCSMACEAGQVCSMGACAATCGPGLTDCSGSCVNTDLDPAHCGACDAACVPTTNATGICLAATCGQVCSAGFSDCDGDILDPMGNGCEIDSASDTANCGFCGNTCTAVNGTPGCTMGACDIAMCDAGFDDCNTMVADGCEVDTNTDAMNCGMCGTACMMGQVCVAGACAAPIGESCASPFVLMSGMNTVDWNAFNADYLTANPSCVPFGMVTGPDVVMSYTATVNGILSYTVDKPASQRWVIVASGAACGMVTPELSCSSEFGPTTLSGSFPVTMGTTYYFYISDTTSGTAPLSDPFTMTITEVVPPCTPGMGGVVGSTVTRVGSGLTALTEYYMEPDQSATGYVYFGGNFDLHRIRKAGGSSENVEAAASIGTAQLGYAFLVDGMDIYTVNDATTATSGRLWRISSDGGATWTNTDYASFATAPNDDFRGVTAIGGNIYMITHEFTGPTQIWSVPAGAGSLPAAATMVGSFMKGSCSGLDADSTYFYTACGDEDEVVRVHRTTFAVEVLDASLTPSTTKNSINAHDTSGDGIADVLYINISTERAHYLCGFSALPAFVGSLADWGGTTSNYGLGFDSPTVLWGYDDDTEDLIRIQ